MALVIHNKATDDKIADGNVSDGSALLFEGNWYFNPSNVQLDQLIKTERTYHCPYKGIAFWYDMQINGETVRNIAWVYEDPHAGYELIKNRIGFYTRETAGTVAREEVSA